MGFADLPLWERMSDGCRWHARHGPIDLILDVEGDDVAVHDALAAARRRFHNLLDELVRELPELRRVLDARPHRLNGEVARAMLAAVEPYREQCVTPMAAVAGAVGDRLLNALCSAAPLRRASVNNGGDVALFLAPGESYTFGLFGDIAKRRESARISIAADSGIGGVATSGWRGRSHSLGIADAVTVLAPSAAAADAAATLIANAVDLPDSTAIRRQAASTLSPDSDLGERAVTVGVDILRAEERELALVRGERVALNAVASGSVLAVRLELQASTRFVSTHKLADIAGTAWGLVMSEQIVRGQTWNM